MLYVNSRKKNNFPQKVLACIVLNGRTKKMLSQKWMIIINLRKWNKLTFVTLQTAYKGAFHPWCNLAHNVLSGYSSKEMLRLTVTCSHNILVIVGSHVQSCFPSSARHAGRTHVYVPLCPPVFVKRSAKGNPCL